MAVPQREVIIVHGQTAQPGKLSCHSRCCYSPRTAYLNYECCSGPFRFEHTRYLVCWGAEHTCIPGATRATMHASSSRRFQEVRSLHGAVLESVCRLAWGLGL
eukprot:13771773-Alexandrium_andersonii.AAC.1